MGRLASTALVASSFFMLLATLGAPFVHAQEALPGVGRVSLLAGSSSILRDGFSQVTAAVQNAPLFDRDELTTADGSRAEIEMSSHIFLREDENASVQFTSFAALQRGAQIAAGTVDITVFAGWHGQLPLIQTPSLAFQPDEPGVYRVSVAKDGTSFVTVRNGRADVDTAQGRATLSQGAMLIATGDQDDPEVTQQPASGEDDFDDFNSVRDAHIAQALQMELRYSNFGGASDLALHGRWINDPQYGMAWAPNEPSSWQPYQAGEWVWQNAYGWTWISDEPWGWAPYHYGSWFYRPHQGWLWAPPQDVGYDDQSDWRPARVGFVTLSVGVGWVPLGPADPVPLLGVPDGHTLPVHSPWQNLHMMRILPVATEQNFQSHTLHDSIALSTNELSQIQTYSAVAPIVSHHSAATRNIRSISSAPIRRYFVRHTLPPNNVTTTNQTYHTRLVPVPLQTVHRKRSIDQWDEPQNVHDESLTPGDAPSNSVQIIDGSRAEHRSTIPVDDGASQSENERPQTHTKNHPSERQNPSAISRAPLQTKIMRVQEIRKSQVRHQSQPAEKPRSRTPVHLEHKHE